MAMLPVAGNVIKAQPKLSIDMGIGFYEPTLVGFDQNETVQFPTKSIFNRNMLLNWGIYYEFFNNARIGYNSFTSYEIGKNILLINSEAVFRRSLTYRIFPIETFFRWRPNIELNFTLAPIWGRARIEMDTTPGDKTDDWNYFITSFGGSVNPVSDMGATDHFKHIEVRHGGTYRNASNEYGFFLNGFISCRNTSQAMNGLEIFGSYNWQCEYQVYGLK